MPDRPDSRILRGVALPLLAAFAVVVTAESLKPAATSRSRAATEAPAKTAERPRGKATLKFEAAKPGQTSGKLVFEGRTLSFQAFTDGKQVASAKLGYVVSNLLATRKLPAGEVTLDGNGMVLDAPAREIFAELASALEQQLDPWTGNTTPEQDLLVRAVAWWAAAPVGTKLEKDVIDRRQPGTDADRVRTSKKPGACDRDDEQGVSQLAGGCRYGTYAEVCHDAGKAHCWRCEVVKNGCDAARGCPGRCGAGCGFSGSGVYSRDCADLDRCCAENGGCNEARSEVCADEWREAADDFFFAPANCLTTGC